MQSLVIGSVSDQKILFLNSGVKEWWVICVNVFTLEKCCMLGGEVEVTLCIVFK